MSQLPYSNSHFIFMGILLNLGCHSILIEIEMVALNLFVVEFDHTLLCHIT